MMELGKRHKDIHYMLIPNWKFKAPWVEREMEYHKESPMIWTVNTLPPDQYQLNIVPKERAFLSRGSTHARKFWPTLTELD